MINNKTITAVLFVYNEETFIHNMISSILGQVNCSVDEIIIVDDQSTDNTKVIVKELQNNYDIISYHHNPNKGKTNALILGLELVKSDLFFIGAGDDEILPHYVEYMYNKVLAEKGLDYAYAKGIVTDSNLQNPKKLVRKEYYILDEIIRNNLLGGYLFGKREVLDYILPLPKDLSYEDWFIAMKLAKKYRRSHISEVGLFKYRRHAQSDTIRLSYNLINRKINMINRLINDDLLDFNNQELQLIQNQLNEYINIYPVLKSIYSEGYKPKEVLKNLFNNSATFKNKVRLFLRLLPFISGNTIKKLDSKFL